MIKIGLSTHRSNAIGFGQGGSFVAEPVLLRQVQNYVTHGMAGFKNSLNRLFLILRLTIIIWIATLGEEFKEDSCHLLTV